MDTTEIARFTQMCNKRNELKHQIYNAQQAMYEVCDMELRLTPFQYRRDYPTVRAIVQDVEKAEILAYTCDSLEKELNALEVEMNKLLDEMRTGDDSDFYNEGLSLCEIKEEDLKGGF